MEEEKLRGGVPGRRITGEEDYWEEDYWGEEEYWGGGVLGEEYWGGGLGRKSS